MSFGKTFCPEDSKRWRAACNTSIPETSFSLAVLDSPSLTSAGNTPELMSTLLRGTIFESCVVLSTELKSTADVNAGLETNLGNKLCVGMATDCVILVGGNIQGPLARSERPGAVMVLELKTALDGIGNNDAQVSGGTIDGVGGVPTTPGVADRPNLIAFVLETEVDGVNVAIVTGDTIDDVGGVPKTPDNIEGFGLIMALVLETGDLDTELLITDGNLLCGSTLTEL